MTDHPHPGAPCPRAAAIISLQAEATMAAVHSNSLAGILALCLIAPAMGFEQLPDALEKSHASTHRMTMASLALARLLAQGPVTEDEKRAIIVTLKPRRLAEKLEAAALWYEGGKGEISYDLAALMREAAAELSGSAR